MANLIDVWKLIHDELRAQRETEKKRHALAKLTSRNLDIQVIEKIAQEAAKLRPGFYTRVMLADGAVIEMGIKEGSKPTARQPDEKF